MPASYPSSAKAFTTKNTGNTVQADHVNDLQLEVTAIESDLLAGGAVTRGMTGRTSLTAGSLLVGNGTSPVALEVFETETRIVAMEVFS